MLDVTFIYMNWVYAIILIAYIVTVLGIIAVVVSENRNPVKSLAWVTAVLLLPLIGMILYAFFGRSLKSKLLISKNNKRKLQRREMFKGIDENTLNLSSESKQEIRLAKSLSGASYFPGNKIDIFTNGKDKFDALKADLNNAKSYIHLQYYIFENDEIGHEIREILMRKAREGVKVRVIYDHVGSFSVDKRFFQEMRDAGVEALPFLRVSFPLVATRINWRNHRKVTVIDGEIGYIGGMNIADRYVKGVSFGIWRDTHLRIVGPSVGGLQYSFAVDWNFMGQPLLEESTKHYDVPDNAVAGVQLMQSGPTGQWSTIAFMFLKAITNAKSCVYIQTPYFLPTEALLKALQVAALSKVDVRIMMPMRSDSAMLTYGSFSYIDECLLAGVKIYLYNKGMIHAKTVIVDEEFASTGSTNFDFRSFEHNFECNAFVYSTEFNKRMKKIFLDDERDCKRITLAEWRNRSKLDKIKESVIRLLSPIL
jgi:cardiolipin synthase